MHRVHGDPCVSIGPYNKSPIEFVVADNSITFDLSRDIIENSDVEMYKIFAPLYKWAVIMQCPKLGEGVGDHLLESRTSLNRM